MSKRSSARPLARPSSRRRLTRFLTVEAVEARRLLATLTVNTTDNSGGAPNALSLNQAIQITNGTLDPTTLPPLAQGQIVGSLAAANTINFQIAGAGVQTINFNPAYSITAPVTINGYSQPLAHANTLAQGNDAVLLIQLTGTDPYNQDGIEIDTGGVTLQGLVINGNHGAGIRIDAGAANTGNIIQGNFLGTNAAGTAPAAGSNTDAGIVITSASNTIGGTTAASRNVISGNGGYGILINPDGTDASHNLIQNNYIGTNAAGTAALANGSYGIELLTGGDSTTIGGSAVGARNVISGNTVDGISVETSNNVIQSNYIGTDASGLVAVGNLGVGVRFQLDSDGAGSNNLLGGAGLGNVISGNSFGVEIDGQNDSSYAAISMFDVVQGNLIGVNATDSGVLPNSEGGVEITEGSAQNTFGGLTSGAGNVISGNNGPGLTIEYDNTTDATQNLIQGNFIGTDTTGLVSLPNQGDGISLSTTSNTVGPGNLIANNVGNGISVEFSTGNAVVGNTFRGNTGQGIDLGNDGITPNTPGGPHSGPNNLQNYPVLTSAYDFHDGTVVTGTLNSTPSTTFTIQFYDSAVADTATVRPGGAFVATSVSSITVTTNASGNGTFTATIPSGASVGSYIAATATDPNGNTSEFAASLPVFDAFTVVNINDSGPGSFRQAILNADAHAGVDTVRFAIPGAGVHIIAPTTTGLPAVTDPTIIDATTQGGYAGTPLIQLDGSSLSTFGVNGLLVSAGNSQVSGLSIVRFQGNGLVLFGSGQSRVTANFIGLTPAGASAANQFDGLLILGSSDNTIGDGTVTGRNVISGNTANGIEITDSGTATGDVAALRNILSGNIIGLDPIGSVVRSNGSDGVLLDGGVTSTSLVNNLISGNGGYGIAVEDGVTGTIIQGNGIGVDQSGGRSRGNSAGGIALLGARQSEVLRNQISGNGGDGVRIYGFDATDNQIAGNTIGLDSTGRLALGNFGDGISVYGGRGNVLGDFFQQSNRIAANRGPGIRLTSYTDDGGATFTSDHNDVVNNVIGKTSDSQPLGNGGSGVLIESGTTNTNVSFNDLDNSGTLTPPTAAGIRIMGIGTSGNMVFDNGIEQSVNLGIAIMAGASDNLISSNNVSSTYGAGIGILLDGAGTTGNTLIGNFVTQSDQVGLQISGGASNNAIGTLAPGAGNRIIGNYGVGVLITDPGTTGNVVEASTIVMNRYFGLKIAAGASGNLVGGAIADSSNFDANVVLPANVISGNFGVGLGIAGVGTTANLVEGNFIGLDYSGTSDGNLYDGVAIFDSATGNTVGGSRTSGGPTLPNHGPGNLISSNGASGVRLGGTDPNPGTSGGIGNSGITANSTSNLIQGNFIGVGVVGSDPRGNLDGIQVMGPANVIGGTDPGVGNIIAGNFEDGIHFLFGVASDTAPRVLVQGNLIGEALSANGTVATALGNAQGIEFDPGTTALVGGLGSGVGNQIRFNRGSAILVNANAEGVSILSNSIAGNADGIVLGLGTPFNGNDGQPSPVLSLPVVNGSNVVISGTVKSGPNSRLLVQVFLNASDAPPGAPQGQTLVANVAATTDASGLASFSVTLPRSVGDGPSITATSTDLGTDNTSAFSSPVNLGTVQFASANTDVTDDVTFANVIVTRTGASFGPVSVAYATANGTALAGVDYTATAGTLNFAAGQTTQTIQIPILDSLRLGAADKFFTLNLANASGDASLGQQASTTVTIVGANNLVVTNTNDSGRGSLRRAIALIDNPENASAAPFTITFAIPGGGTQVIRPLTTLPTINYPFTLDGFSQPGSARNILTFGESAPPAILLDGSALSRDSNASGLDLAGGNSVVQGLAIGAFPVAGIVLEYGGGNVVRGNFLGTDPTGTIALPNGKDGIYIVDSSNNVIGGATVDARNLISGNGEVGVLIQGNEPLTEGQGIVRLDASHNLVINNYIGTNASGFGSLANGLDGVFIQSASNNVIGQPGGLGGNLISGNGSVGVQVFSTLATGNLIQGNLIGSNARATAGLGNRADGVYLNQAPGNVVGGGSPGQGNIIVANGFSGVDVFQASGNTIQGNAIGILPGGGAAGNAAAGVLLDTSSGNTVGGAGSAANTIAFNGFAGIEVVRNGQLIVGNAPTGNTIGTNQLGGNTSPQASARTVRGVHPRGATAQLRAIRVRTVRSR